MGNNRGTTTEVVQSERLLQAKVANYSLVLYHRREMTHIAHGFDAATLRKNIYNVGSTKPLTKALCSLN